MNINLGGSVAEELTRVAGVLAGFDSHEVSHEFSMYLYAHSSFLVTVLVLKD